MIKTLPSFYERGIRFVLDLRDKILQVVLSQLNKMRLQNNLIL